MTIETFCLTGAVLGALVSVGAAVAARMTPPAQSDDAPTSLPPAASERAFSTLYDVHATAKHDTPR